MLQQTGQVVSLGDPGLFERLKHLGSWVSQPGRQQDILILSCISGQWILKLNVPLERMIRIRPEWGWSQYLLSTQTLFSALELEGSTILPELAGL